MRYSIKICVTVLLCVAVTACGSLRAPEERAERPAIPESGSKPPPPEIVQDRPDSSVAQDLPYAPLPPGGERENLTCFSGTENRHARIGVELVNGDVTYFAYYSKWKPRTCSLDAGRNDAVNQWVDGGAYSTVVLAGEKGELRIERKGSTYRFAFLNVDRTRYCGMPGKINGSLVVTRGRSNCIVEGIMDGHGDLAVR